MQRTTATLNLALSSMHARVEVELQSLVARLIMQPVVVMAKGTKVVGSSAAAPRDR